MNGAIECVLSPPPRVGPLPVSGPSIGGIIEIEANARADKDTAELIEEFGASTLTQAEQLPSAVILGGYLSGAAGVYDPSAELVFGYPQDARDRYCIELLPGQEVDIELFGDPGETQLRVLRAADGSPVTSTGFSSDLIKQVTLPGDEARGNYVIDLEVQDQSGPFRYVLSSSPTGGVLNLHWPDGDFIPGEAVVQLRDQGQFAAQSAGYEAQMTLERGLGGNLHKVTMPPMMMAQGGSVVDPKRQTIEWVEALRRRSDVVSASPNYVFQAFAAFDAVSEPLYPSQWHYPLINLPQAWQLAPSGGAGVDVAVLDTGLFRFDNQWHEDLQANLPECGPGTCADFVDGGLPEDPGSAVGGSVYHGTHVAGTVAASGFNGLGGSGVAPSARILPVRVLNESGSGSLDDIIAAIDWARGAGAEVINLSLGSPSNTPELRRAVDEAAAAGVLIVAAAGNAPNEQLIYPAAYGNVFGVGAVDGAGLRAGYSNIGPSVDLMGPGGDTSRDANQDGRADVVISASGNESGPTYAGLQGTSMAAPHVAGVFALMKDLQPALDTQLLLGLLANGEITNDPPADSAGYGKGLIDAARAVQVASDPTLTLLSPASVVLEFSAGIETRTLLLNKVGLESGDVVVEEVQVRDSAPWLSVEVPQTAEGGFSIIVRIDRQQLQEGRAYRNELRVVYRSNGTERDLFVPVIVAVESPIATREAGLHFVLLIDEENNPVAQTQVTSTGGFYSFAFDVVESVGDKTRINQVVAGQSYYLIAGTDMDNNGLICSPGEACAEYPIAGLREKVSIVLNGDGTAVVEDSEGQVISSEQLVMTTSFARPLSALSLPRPGFAGYKLLESAHRAAPRSPAE